MTRNVLYAICVFLTAWNGVVIGANALNDSLESVGVFNILFLAFGITGIVLHADGML